MSSCSYFLLAILTYEFTLPVPAPAGGLGVQIAAPLTTPGDQRGEPDFRCATISQQKASLFGLARFIVTIPTNDQRHLPLESRVTSISEPVYI